MESAPSLLDIFCFDGYFYFHRYFLCRHFHLLAPKISDHELLLSFSPHASFLILVGICFSTLPNPWMCWPMFRKRKLLQSLLLESARWQGSSKVWQFTSSRLLCHFFNPYTVICTSRTSDYRVSLRFWYYSYLVTLIFCFCRQHNPVRDLMINFPTIAYTGQEYRSKVLAGFRSIVQICCHISTWRSLQWQRLHPFGLGSCLSRRSQLMQRLPFAMLNN